MIAESIREKVDSANPLTILSYDDFLESKVEKFAVAKELSNLFKRGILKRVSKGLYYKPSYSRFGELSPTDNDILMKYLELSTDKIGYISGTNIYRGMGLTTQLSKEFVIVNDTRQGTLDIQNICIKFVKSPLKLQSINSTEDIPLLRILDALLDIKYIPACTPSNAVYILTRIVKDLSEEKKQRLYLFSLSYKPVVRALLGMIFDITGETQLQELLKKTLNPLTKFQIGLESSLPTKQWNII